MDGAQILESAQHQDGSPNKVAGSKLALRTSWSRMYQGPFRELGNSGGREWARFESSCQGQT